MAGITGLMPRHGNTQRLIGSRIPITGTAGCRAYLYWHGTDRTDTAYRDIIRADGQPPILPRTNVQVKPLI